MRALLLVMLVAVLAWGAGLAAFADRVARSTPASRPTVPSDGVVALTGGSSLRIEAAEGLLQAGLAQRLLISGVNPEATRGEVREAVGGRRRLFDCCVDLGFQAENTVGNARETADWANYHRYRSLIVVTADYHMPRALLELHGTMPGVALTPYPVATQTLDAHRWWKAPGSAKRMVVEYCKYLAVLGRGVWHGVLTRLHPTGPAQGSASSAAQTASS